MILKNSLNLDLKKYKRDDNALVYGEKKWDIINNRKVYSTNYNPVLEYIEHIKKDKVNTSKKIKLAYKYIGYLINNSKEYHYSSKKANKVFEFAENYCHYSKGKMAGKKVVLELWEKALLGVIFGIVDKNEERKFQRIVLIIGKKNGKSFLDSIIGLYMQYADGEGGPEVYSVATKREQAKIVWEEAKRMVKKSPALNKRARCLVNGIFTDYNDGIFKALASDSDKLDGLNVYCGIMDEWHQWKNGRALYDIIADGTTARETPLIVLTSTAGTIRGDIFDEIYEDAEQFCNQIDSENFIDIDQRSIFFIYELDKKEEWRDIENWQKANPGLGTIKNIKALQDKALRVNENIRLEKNFVCKEFNIRETSIDSWLHFNEFNNLEKFNINTMNVKYAIGGSDLSSTTDLTCGTIIFKLPNDEKIYVEQMYFLPEELLEKRVQEDGIRYDLWKEQGWLRTTPGNKIDYHDLEEWFQSMYLEKNIVIAYHGYDAWSAQYYVLSMREFFGKEGMEEVYQGKKTLSSPMKNLEADFKAGKVVYNNNPILKMCIANTVVDMDKNGNIQPHKGKNQRKRIDGLASLLNAYTVYERHKNEYEEMIK